MRPSELPCVFNFVAGSPTKSDEADASSKDRSEPLDQAADADPPAAEPAKKKSQKKGGKKRVPSAGEKDPEGETHPGEGSSEDSLVKKKKTKRSRESHGDGEGRDGLAEDSVAEGFENEASEERLRKTAKKKGAPKQARRSPAPESTLVRSHDSPRAGNEVGVRSPSAKLLPGDIQSGQDLADAAPSRKKSDPQVAEETVEEGDSLARENSPRGVDMTKIVEEQEKSGLANKSSSPVSVGQVESHERNKEDEQVVSTDALDPEAGLPTTPVEDPSAPKEFPA
ncbi:hypothetical protein Bca101_082717 [Brassica carinata]